MIHVRLTKLSSRRGKPRVLAAGYTVLGHTIHLPTVGQVFRVIEYSRGGRRVNSITRTSTVESVRTTKHGLVIKTLNSRYLVTVLAPVARRSL